MFHSQAVKRLKFTPKIRPDPLGEFKRSPRHLAAIRGLLLREEGRKRWRLEREMKNREGGRRGEERDGKGGAAVVYTAVLISGTGGTNEVSGLAYVSYFMLLATALHPSSKLHFISFVCIVLSTFYVY